MTGPSSQNHVVLTSIVQHSEGLILNCSLGAKSVRLDYGEMCNIVHYDLNILLNLRIVASVSGQKKTVHHVFFIE